SSSAAIWSNRLSGGSMRKTRIVDGEYPPAPQASALGLSALPAASAGEPQHVEGPARSVGLGDPPHGEHEFVAVVEQGADDADDIGELPFLVGKEVVAQSVEVGLLDPSAGGVGLEGADGGGLLAQDGGEVPLERPE